VAGFHQFRHALLGYFLLFHFLGELIGDNGLDRSGNRRCIRPDYASPIVTAGLEPGATLRRFNAALWPDCFTRAPKIADLIGDGRSKLPPSVGRRSGEPRSHFLSAGAPLPSQALTVTRRGDRARRMTASVAKLSQLDAVSERLAPPNSKKPPKRRDEAPREAARNHTTPT
jgi:hypothetical protein